MKKYAAIVATGLLLLTGSAFGTSCDDVKAQIQAKIDANHVVGYSLDVVDKGSDTGGGKVVGTCGGGTKDIVYSRQAAGDDASQAAPAPAPTSQPAPAPAPAPAPQGTQGH